MHNLSIADLKTIASDIVNQAEFLDTVCDTALFSET